MKEQVVYLYQVSFAKRLTHVILLTKRLPALARTVETVRRPGGSRRGPPRTPRLAIIIDDIGYADLVADQLRDLGIPLTAAVIPDAPYARSEAQRLHDYGLEEIIHLPMQPKDPANHHPRDEFVLIDSSDAEIAALLQNAQAAGPVCPGAEQPHGLAAHLRPAGHAPGAGAGARAGAVLRRLQDHPEHRRLCAWPGR